MHKPNYQYKPIARLDSLAKTLKVDVDDLLRISESCYKLYYHNVQTKDNGKKRLTYSVQESLKTIHNNIKNHILKKVYFPEYLQGAFQKILENK